jgi:uncharacterized protein YerC
MKKIDRNTLEQLTPIRSSVQRLEDARNMPHIKELLGNIWQTNELHILFADTGVGKSILAVAAIDAITKGKGFLFLKNENEPLISLLYDFELSDRQFRKRYTDDLGCEYAFSNKFLADTIDFQELDNLSPGTQIIDLLFERIKFDIETTGAQVLVIDNITFLSGQNTQDTQVALEVMRKLNELKKQYNLSILVLAHSPKLYGNNPISINDLAGSKNLSIFADSVSAIGKSCNGKNLRYWKQVKPSRSGEMIYDASNVIILEIEKQASFLTMKCIGFAEERDHLISDYGSKEAPKQMAEVIELLKQGKTYDDIASQLDISKGTISKWKNKFPQQFDFVSNVS